MRPLAGRPLPPTALFKLQTVGLGGPLAGAPLELPDVGRHPLIALQRGLLRHELHLQPQREAYRGTDHLPEDRGLRHRVLLVASLVLTVTVGPPPFLLRLVVIPVVLLSGNALVQLGRKPVHSA